MTDARVAVVGGGATGLAVARDLALRGVEPVVLERDRLVGGAATTGRSHGLLHSGARYAVDDPDGARECVAENRVLRSTGGACVRETGGYFLELAADDPDYFDRKRRACTEAGIDATVVDGADLREREPVAEDVERALAVPDAVVYPSRLLAATAADARANGADLRERAPVTDLVVGDGRVTGVRVGEDGVVDVDHVVLAAGAWTTPLANTAGVSVPTRPTSGVMVPTPLDGLDAVLNRCRPAADGDIVVPHRGEAVLGTTSEAVDDPDDYPTDEAAVERVRRECARMLAADAADLPARRPYWGVRPLYDPNQAGEERAISRGFALLDHRDRDDLAGLTTLVGGKLTTHRLMGEAAADLVCERLGVAGTCRTDERSLPAEDPAALDELVREFGGPAPADAGPLDGAVEP